MTLYFLSAYLLIINAAAFLLMLADKHRARKKLWRVPENIFLLFALLGGSVGILAGMYSFRHKTRKPKFYICVPVILAAQILFIVWRMGT